MGALGGFVPFLNDAEKDNFKDLGTIAKSNVELGDYEVYIPGTSCIESESIDPGGSANSTLATDGKACDSQPSLDTSVFTTSVSTRPLTVTSNVLQRHQVHNIDFVEELNSVDTIPLGTFDVPLVHRTLNNIRWHINQESQINELSSELPALRLVGNNGFQPERLHGLHQFPGTEQSTIQRHLRQLKFVSNDETSWASQSTVASSEKTSTTDPEESSFGSSNTAELSSKDCDHDIESSLIQPPSGDINHLSMPQGERKELIEQLMEEVHWMMGTEAFVTAAGGSGQSLKSADRQLSLIQSANGGVRKMQRDGRASTHRGESETSSYGHDPSEPDNEPENDPVPSRRLACPYFQRNPSLYKSWRACPGPGFTSAHRVK